jgi:hypothetical protein
VLCVPQIQKHLLSIQKFTADNSVYLEFWPNFFLVKDQLTHQVLMRGPSKGGVYQYRPPTLAAYTASISAPTLDDLHLSLGHPNVSKLKALAAQNHIQFSASVLSPCASCHLGKLAKIPLVSRPHTSTKSFQLIFSNV